ncbi:hypothetical protein GF376_01600 [Candidatus Peregrinibacteria bacterium]|nr:hypothetical protein [Candidatus Peregrinibacteria bacterium]
MFTHLKRKLDTRLIYFAESAENKETTSARPEGERFVNRYGPEFYWKKGYEKHDEFMERTPLIAELDRARSTPSFEEEWVYRKLRPEYRNHEGIIQDLRNLRAARFSFSDDKLGNFSDFKLHYQEHIGRWDYLEGFEMDEISIRSVFEKYEQLPIKTRNLKQLSHDIAEAFITEINIALDKWLEYRQNAASQSDFNAPEFELKETKSFKKVDSNGTLENSITLSEKIKDQEDILSICGGETIRIVPNGDKIGKVEIIQKGTSKDIQSVEDIFRERRARGMASMESYSVFQNIKNHRAIASLLDTFRGKPLTASTIKEVEDKIVERSQTLRETLPSTRHYDHFIETLGIAKESQHFTYLERNMLALNYQSKISYRMIPPHKYEFILIRDERGHVKDYISNIPGVNKKQAEKNGFKQWFDRVTGASAVLDPQDLDADMADKIADKINKFRQLES